MIVDERDRLVRAALYAARIELDEATDLNPLYLVVADPEFGDLPADVPTGSPARVLVEARLATTRLIDNLPLEIG